MPKIVYDRRNCEGYFVCVTMAPDDFKEDENRDGDDVAELLGGKEPDDGLWTKTIDEDDVEEALSAAQGCPADVIKVLDDDGNVLEGPETLPIEA